MIKLLDRKLITELMESKKANETQSQEIKESFDFVEDFYEDFENVEGDKLNQITAGLDYLKDRLSILDYDELMAPRSLGEIKSQDYVAIGFYIYTLLDKSSFLLFSNYSDLPKDSKNFYFTRLVDPKMVKHLDIPNEFKMDLRVLENSNLFRDFHSWRNTLDHQYTDATKNYYSHAFAFSGLVVLINLISIYQKY